jgi:hypothetical protein
MKSRSSPLQKTEITNDRMRRASLHRSGGLRKTGAALLLVAMHELVFEVSQEADGGYVAEARGESIFTQAESWEELRKNVREAVAAFYFDRQGPFPRIRVTAAR